MGKNNTSTHTSPDGLLNLYQEISVKYFKRLVLSSGLSANRISWLNFCINNIGAVICYAVGTYTATLIGLLFCMASAIFDYLDGVVARETGARNSLGKWLDPSLDNIWQLLFVSSVFYGCYQNPFFIPQQYMLPIGLCAIFSLSMANIMGFELESEYHFHPYTGSRIFRKEVDKLENISIVDRIILNAVFPYTPVFIFLFTIRYLIIIGTIFRILDVVLLIIAIAKTLHFLLLFFILYRVKSDESEPKLFAIRILKSMG